MSNKISVKISIIVAAWNRPELLPATIESLLNQTFRDFEIIIVDDGDEIRSDMAVSEFAPKDKRPVKSGDTFVTNGIPVTYIQHDKNYGSPVAKNTGIKRAQGEWIGFLDDDDEYMPHTLAKRYEVIKKYGDQIGYLYSGVEFLNVNTEQIVQKRMKLNGLGNFYDALLPYHLKPITSTVMIRADVLRGAGMFDEKIPANQEMDLLFRIADKYQGYGIDAVLVQMKGDHGLRMGTDLDRRVRGKKYMLKKHHDRLSKYPKVLAAHYYILADILREKGDYHEAREYYQKAYKQDKTRKKALYLYLALMFPIVYKLLIRIKN